jgi:hypothetical protein
MSQGKSQNGMSDRRGTSQCQCHDVEADLGGKKVNLNTGLVAVPKRFSRLKKDDILAPSVSEGFRKRDYRICR